MGKRAIMTIMIFTVPLIAAELATDFGSYIRWLGAFCLAGGSTFA